MNYPIGDRKISPDQTLFLERDMDEEEVPKLQPKTSKTQLHEISEDIKSKIDRGFSKALQFTKAGSDVLLTIFQFPHKLLLPEKKKP